MGSIHQNLFYEIMWRAHARSLNFPLPWWVQKYFQKWVDQYDRGLFDSKEAAFASNALYRYWNMIGVKDRQEECLVGQSGEIEPVYGRYTMSFFLFDAASGHYYFPQDENAQVFQEHEKGYLPVIQTTWLPVGSVKVIQKVFASVEGSRERSVVLSRFRIQSSNPSPKLSLCIYISGFGPSGFERDDRAGRISPERKVHFIEYKPDVNHVEVNTDWGPLFDRAPADFGLYGNDSNSTDPDHYLGHNPFADLSSGGVLNKATQSTDLTGGLCTGLFSWSFQLNAEQDVFELNVLLPIDDYRGEEDLAELRSLVPGDLEAANRAFWEQKLEQDGLQINLPEKMKDHLDLYRVCRANLLILSDGGEIHPGPTIYDSFWIRDSSVEGIACALAGDGGLSNQQFGKHYINQFHSKSEQWNDVDLKGFFGGTHEMNDAEWDCNGQALWAFGMFDRISGAEYNFGRRVFEPFVTQGARWININRSPFGLLKSGWSAEHLGGKGEPHYWDDFWCLAGLYEAGMLGKRINAPQTQEIWDIYDDLRKATTDSILWVLQEQRSRGFWETFIPTGPAGVGRLDSTIIGTVGYFHPCRLYMNKKLGAAIDEAARQTLETIWGHFVREGGFEHNSAWNAYGPYLTLQLAHAFLYIGDIGKMNILLNWAIYNAGLASERTAVGNIRKIVLGGWNEQHCYPVATQFSYVPNGPWYMGDIPHGWACAEFMLLIRHILFFEADEDNDPHLFLAPGITEDWFADHAINTIEVKDAPTTLGRSFGYRLTVDKTIRVITFEIAEARPSINRFVFPCHFGNGVIRAEVDGQAFATGGKDIVLPGSMKKATFFY